MIYDKWEIVAMNSRDARRFFGKEYGCYGKEVTVHRVCHLPKVLQHGTEPAFASEKILQACKGIYRGSWFVRIEDGSVYVGQCWVCEEQISGRIGAGDLADRFDRILAGIGEYAKKNSSELLAKFDELLAAEDLERKDKGPAEAA